MIHVCLIQKCKHIMFSRYTLFMARPRNNVYKSGMISWLLNRLLLMLRKKIITTL